MSMDYRDILGFDMFAADRDTGVQVLRNRMVRVRKAHSCVICGQKNIWPGQVVRAQTERDRCYGIATFYACLLCCEAMALSATDAGVQISHRYALNSADTSERGA